MPADEADYIYRTFLTNYRRIRPILLPIDSTLQILRLLEHKNLSFPSKEKMHITNLSLISILLTALLRTALARYPCLQGKISVLHGGCGQGFECTIVKDTADRWCRKAGRVDSTSQNQAPGGLHPVSLSLFRIFGRCKL